MKVNQVITTIFDGAVLTRRERDVVVYRLQGKTLLETGEKLDLSRERIRQIECKALGKIRGHYFRLHLELQRKWEQEK